MTPASPVTSYAGSSAAVQATARLRALRRPAANERITSFRLSYWLLLAFLILLYANTPFLLPALEVLRPAKVVAIGLLLALVGETVFGRYTLDLAFPEGAWLAAFLGAAILSCVTALWPGYAVDSVQELIKMTLVFFMLVNCAATLRTLRGVMWVIVIGGLFPALGTLHNYQTGNMYEGRAAWLGIFGNPNEVAYSLAILIPIALYLAWSSGWFARLSLLGICTLFVGAIFVTFSRGGLLGLGAAIEFFALRKKSVWLQVAILVAVLAGGTVAASHWSRNQDFSDIDNDLTFQQRIVTSEVGIQMLEDHPLLGVGIDCSVVAWPLYAPVGFSTRGALITHNTFVQVFSETGFLGGIPYVVFLGIGLFSIRRRTKGTPAEFPAIAIEAALWGFVICGLSGGYVVTWFPYILLGLAAAAGRIAMNGKLLETTPEL